jgi:hypothetical protein
MHCYRHAPAIAVGACAACFKDVCNDCGEDPGFALACSTKCGDWSRQVREVNEKAAGILQQRRSMMRTSVLFTTILGLVLLAAGAFFTWKYNDRFDLYFYATGGAFLYVAIATYRRSRLGVRAVFSTPRGNGALANGLEHDDLRQTHLKRIML